MTEDTFWGTVYSILPAWLITSSCGRFAGHI